MTSIYGWAGGIRWLAWSGIETEFVSMLKISS